MKPGTYRIVNLNSGTAITANHRGTVGWHKQDSKDQQWFAQASGKGYRFRNIASGGYLAVTSTTDSDNRLYCGEYPTTWALVTNPDHSGHEVYGIMIGDTDRMLDLIHAYSRARHNGSTKHRTWRFERISDETGEELPSLTQTKEALSRAEKTIQTQASEIEFLRKLLLDGRKTQNFVVDYNPQHPNNID
ncbi:unnamed protein product [Rhizoctonia solani]|nr:unnamed protein product [Rhizoctonia solani]